jgi:hypothetical protein
VVCAAYILLGYPLSFMAFYKSLISMVLVEIIVSFIQHNRLIFAAYSAISACLCAQNDINHES